jgi:hypothetical protein
MGAERSNEQLRTTEIKRGARGEERGALVRPGRELNGASLAEEGATARVQE